MRFFIFILWSLTLCLLTDNPIFSTKVTYAVTSSVEPSKKLIPSGKVIGIAVNNEGLLVVDLGEVETQQGIQIPAKNRLQKGDVINQVNNKKIHTKEQFKQLIQESSGKPLVLNIKRGTEEKTVRLTPVYDVKNKTYQIGVWIKDGIQGIGTMTYIDPDNGNYGALGHGIMDGELRQLLAIRKGHITSATVTSIIKGQKGTPGKLSGFISNRPEDQLGNVTHNATEGIYGTLDQEGINYFKGKKMPIGLKDTIEEGYAEILVDLEGTGPKAYEIIIEKVSKNNSETTKGMIIRMIDPRLIAKTSGIVQGMSGSPIVQNGKIIGAVTHVFVQDPTKGYGIFIENMLNHQ